MVRLLHFLLNLIRTGWRSVRQRLYSLQSRSRIARYFRQNAECVRLNIGCGIHILPGWLNLDTVPFGDSAYLHALKRFPIGDETVHFIYCEHLMEHLPYERCEGFLKECLRVLRNGGVLRIATPSLQKLIQYYQGNGHLPVAEMLDYHRQQHNPVTDTLCAWFNDHMRLWGHRFIFDEPTLTNLLRRVGFSQIVPCRFRESRHSIFEGIEYDGEGILWEREACCMIFEATKPFR